MTSAVMNALSDPARHSIPGHPPIRHFAARGDVWTIIWSSFG